MADTDLPRSEDHGSGCLDAELLASYIDGRATMVERAAVESHLAWCEDCYFAFAEAVREQAQRGVSQRETVHSRWYANWFSRVAVAVAVAAVIVIVAVVGSRDRSQPSSNLQGALSDLDAAATSYRRFEPRLTLTTAYRELEPRLRSAAPGDEVPLAVREAALRVQRAASASRDEADTLRALAAMHFALGQAQSAAAVLATEDHSNDARVLSDVAATYLARRADGDVQHALELLERAVKIDPSRAEAWFNLGLAAETARQLPRAREAWTQYLVLDPSSEWASEARWHLEKLQK